MIGDISYVAITANISLQIVLPHFKSDKTTDHKQKPVVSVTLEIDGKWPAHQPVDSTLES